MELSGRFWLAPLALERKVETMGLRGTYWLTRNGTITVAGTEHANYVKRLMLNLQTAEENAAYAPIQRTFDGITEDEVKIHRARGVGEAELSFLLDHKDPRNWALAEWGWVRTKDSQFNSWYFNDETLNMVRSNEKYWNAQRFNIDEHTMIDWNVMGINAMYRVNVQNMLNPAATAAGLLRLQSVEMFRNPGVYRCPACGYELEDAGENTAQCTKCFVLWQK